ncbi:hypothetical protein Cgig2_015540 [Carnegiea gigantea]|uniref:non-specific serine/threonine protein kinase n=1 Tax=Carnegiea gigantea TaxID=171969 RepID=A0A9Q1JFT2_9CARY|nr:hypothetical protein Cgig2_015540 [Carnegiea gigantea]
MASAPNSPGSPDLPLPSTPLTDSSPPPTDSSLPPPSDSSPPAPSDSSPPAPSDSSSLPPSDLSAPPPSTLPIPPPLEVAPPTIDTSSPPPPPLEPLPPPPIASFPPPTDTSPPPIASFPPPADTSPPPPSPEIFPPPPPPPAAVPTPAAVPLSPPPASSPPAPTSPDSVNSPPPPPSSDTTFSPPPPVNSSSPLTPSPPVKSSKHSGSTPGTSTPSTSNTSGDDTLLQNSSSDGDQSVKTGIAIGVVAAFVVICFMLVIVFVRRRRKRHDRYNSVFMLPSQFASPQDSGIILLLSSSFMKPTPSVGSVGGGGGSGGGEFISSSLDSGILGNSKTWFSYEELNVATNGFASQNILGAGGFGCVYKGFLQDGRVVAVKKLKDNGGQGDREFKAEVETISRVHHRHLVSLVGYCVTDYQRLLVFEFLPNNTLDYHLHAPNKPVMEWSLRVKAACGSARGLAYLHEDCHPKIIHRDIKSANILLDHNFEAKVADFGLAKLAQELDLNTHVSTRVMGTFGYMAPEYASSGKLTEKSDVFSFGVVLLEVITGRKPVDQSRDESLVEWARPLMSEALDSQNFDQLADPRLQGNYNRGEMFRMIEAAAACVRHSSSKRPKMSQVVRALDTISELSDISNGMKPGESGIFNSREQSAQIRMFQRMAFGSQDFSSEHGNSQSSWASGGRSGVV